MNHSEVHAEFLRELAASLDAKARAEFGVVEQTILARCLSLCGLTCYPPLNGEAAGERASGDMVCDVCGQEYRAHPSDWRVIGYGDVPFLQVLCDGRRVKL